MESCGVHNQPRKTIFRHPVGDVWDNYSHTTCTDYAANSSEISAHELRRILSQKESIGIVALICGPEIAFFGNTNHQCALRPYRRNCRNLKFAHRIPCFTRQSMFVNRYTSPSSRQIAVGSLNQSTCAGRRFPSSHLCIWKIRKGSQEHIAVE